MAIYRAKVGEKDGKAILGAPFAYDSKRPDSPAAANAAARIKSGEWVKQADPKKA